MAPEPANLKRVMGVRRSLGAVGRCSAGFESNVRATVRALFRAGDPAGKGKPARTSFVRANGGWFGAQHAAPDLPRNAAVLGEEDEHRFKRTRFLR
jgi:hypothetical protein